MVEKKTDKKPAAKKPETKEAPAKKPEAKKHETKKTEAKKPEAKKTAHHEHRAEEIEKKISQIDKKFGLIDKLLKQEWMKKLLASKAMEDVNKSLKSSLKTIFTVIAVLAFIGAVVAFFGFFGLLGLGALGVARGFVLIMAILMLVAAVLNLLTGIGLLKKKTWLPFIVLLTFALQLVLIIISLVGSASSSVGSWVSLIVMAALLLIVLKNKSYFNK